jgi:hypothetical protein
MPTNKKVKVVSVRHAFMSTRRTVSVPTIVTFTVMGGCADIRIELTQ